MIALLTYAPYGMLALVALADPAIIALGTFWEYKIMHHRPWLKLVAGGNEHVVFCGVALRAKSNAHDQLEYH